MKQTTAKTIEQALIWIDSHPHHNCGAEWSGKEFPAGRPNWRQQPSHWFYEGFEGKLRVPRKLFKGFMPKIEPNLRPFDTRMFRITKHGRAWLREQMKVAAMDRAMEAVSQHREKYPGVTAMQLGTLAHKTIFEQMVADGELREES